MKLKTTSKKSEVDKRSDGLSTEPNGAAPLYNPRGKWFERSPDPNFRASDYALHVKLKKKKPLLADIIFKD